MKDLYSENYKSLMKEMEDHTNKYKCSQYWWTRKVNIVKMSALFKEIHRFNTIPNKIPMPFFTELEQIVLNLCGSTKDPEELKQSWEKKHKAWGIMLSDFRLYYKAPVIKTVWYHTKIEI